MRSFTVFCSKQEVCVIQLYHSDEILSLYHCQHSHSQKQYLVCVPVLCIHKCSSIFLPLDCFARQ